jgi:precorrin-6B methylase 2
LSVALFALAAFLAYFFLSGFIWGAGFFPTSRNEIDPVVQLLGLGKDSKFYDLGSGYGRMIINVSEKYGLSTIGVEADPVKCWWTRIAIRRKGLQDRARVINSNFLSVNLRDADGVFVFLSGETGIMDKLREKAFREMKPGGRIVSYVHKFKQWTPEKTEGNLSLYVIPGSVERKSIA